MNTLIKYTYFYNVPTTDQITLRSTAAEFIQKSHVGAVDLTYDLTPRWSIGGKYAHRRGVMSLTRDNPEFFDNTADLFVVRADFRFKENWEGMLEGRVLEMPDLNDKRAGALLVVSRSSERALQGRRGLQLHGLLGRPDRSELRSPRRVHQHDGRAVRRSESRSRGEFSQLIALAFSARRFVVRLLRGRRLAGEAAHVGGDVA